MWLVLFCIKFLSLLFYKTVFEAIFEKDVYFVDQNNDAHNQT